VRRGVVAIVNRYHPPRVIVTCRQRSYVEEAVLPGFDAFTLAAFDAEQMKTFAQAWYNAQKDLGRVDAVQVEHKAADLTRAALTTDLRELASNPMLLTTMALIHQQEVGLPKERCVCIAEQWTCPRTAGNEKRLGRMRWRNFCATIVACAR
jgi:predicted NACHT family NTPase